MISDTLDSLSLATKDLCESLALEPFVGDCGEIALAQALVLNRKISAGAIDKEYCATVMLCRLGYPKREDGFVVPIPMQRGVVHVHTYIDGRAIENGKRLFNYVGIEDLENFCRLRNESSQGEKEYSQKFWTTHFTFADDESDEELMDRFFAWFKREICFDVTGMRFENTIKASNGKLFLDRDIALSHAKLIEDMISDKPAPQS